MSEPTADEISRFHRYFAIKSNNEFWSLSEEDLGEDDKQKLLNLAFTSLYHWGEVGNDENIHLANLAVARAFCISDSPSSVQYIQKAFDYFDEQGADWIQAFTNAVYSHASLIVGLKSESLRFYEKAVHVQSKLSEGDRKVFDATFRLIPVPSLA